MLVLGLLGPVAVRNDGAEVDLRGARQRALVCALGLDARSVVSADVLVDRVWGDGLPASPANALQQQVVKLRRVLGEDAVAYQAPGYRLHLAEDAIDVERFERLLESGRALLADDPSAAEDRLRQAIGLWRGPALADCADRTWAAGPIARLEELRAQAQELHAEALVAVGRHAEAVVDLERLVRAEPLRERAWATLMLARYRGGRQADALSAFREARRTLVDGIGVEPGPALRELHDRILAQDPTLDAPRPTAAPVASGLGGRRRLPAALARHETAGRFVGRDDDLAGFRRAAAEAASGRPGWIFLTGEPGVGKTRLVAEYAREAADAGALVVHGRADEDVAAPYGSFVSVLDQLAAAVDDALLDEHVATHGGALGRLVPRLAARVGDLPEAAVTNPDTEHFRLQEAVAGLITAVARRTPVLIVLDDLHWADRATLVLLLRLVRGLDAPVLTLATVRDTRLDQREPLVSLLPDLLREPASSRVELGGLTEANLLALARALLGGVSDETGAALARAVHRGTAGNALFATEVLRQFADGGGDPDVDVLEVPTSVRDLAVGRLTRIGGPAGEALLAATVIGPAFDADVLARVTGQAEEHLVDGLDVARAAALVVEVHEPPGRYVFAHAVIRTALAETLGPTRRRLLHRRVAEVLDALPRPDAERLGELAHHWIEAGDDRALDAAVRAGDASLELLAPDGALRWYRRALDLHEARESNDPAGRATLLARLGDAERRVGSEAFREHLLEAGVLARDLGDSALLTRAALANNRGMHSRTGVLDEERLAALRDALELRGPVRDGDRALLLATMCSELWSGDHAARRALSDEALAVAREVGDDRVLAEVIYRRAFATAEPATLAERLEQTTELVALTEKLGDPLWRLLASVERSRAAIEAGDLEQAVLHVEEQRRLAASCGHAYGRHGAGWAQGWPSTLAGRYEEAEALAGAALAESMASEQPDSLAFYGAQLSVIRWDQGRFHELADAILMHAQSPEGLPAHRGLAALALAESGRAADAQPLIDEALAGGFVMPVDTIWLTAMVMWGEAVVLCDRADAAPAILEQLLPWRDQVAFTGLAVHGAAARIAAELAGLLGRPEAEELFAQAAELHERIEAPALLARTYAGWARWQWLQGADEPRARELLALARAAADRCGCPHLADRAAAVVEPTL